MAANRLRIERLPLLALAVAALVAALWGGLLRLHWRLPVPHANWISYHGPLMVSGFVGTVISLERAVASGAWPAYGAPLITGVGALCLVIGLPHPIGPALMTLGSAGLVMIFAGFVRRQPTAFTVTMGIGAVAWLVGNVLWLRRWELNDVVPWWMVFLVATIAGERLELTRFLRPTPWKRRLFFLAMGTALAGLVLCGPWPAGGVRLLGGGMVAIAAWFVRFDVARQTVRQEGLPRFVAICLLSGYAWLAVSGVIAVVVGAQRSDLVNDALLHSLFLGFVFAMIFGHAPIIFPAVLGLPVAFRRRFYLHLALLHAALVVRVAADLAAWAPGRRWAGLVNALTLLLFLINTVSSIRSRPSPAPE
ncbi:MAG: hypothetical protein PVF51_01890 [Nitrospirota bacterium]|jgi:hypothetical protein